MTPTTTILAHDFGTTGNKATLLDAERGEPLASVFAPYDTTYPHPNWAEQDPGDWARALFEGTRALLARSGVAPGAVAVVSFSGHMHGALPVDAAGRPLRPAIIWADQRAAAEAKVVRERCGAERVYRTTGHRVSAVYTAEKVMWIKANEPEVYAQAARVLQSKDYGAYLLSGVFATDCSDASGTQVFDLAERRWSSDLLAEMGLRADLFPEAFPSATVVGRVTQEAAQASGLLEGTPVVIGGGDGACATVGSGAVDEGDIYNYIGSSAWIALTSRRPIFDPQQRTNNFIHMDPELVFPIGSMQAAGGSYTWFERLLRPEGEDDALYDGLDRSAAAVPPGARGLLFLPYLMGERSPYWNPLARGAFVGLSMAHGRGELARAVLEGVAFNLRSILGALSAQGVSVQSMRLIGGGARSPVWRQILADVYELPVVLPSLPAEATSLGAAIAGGIGVGIYPDYRVAKQLVPVREAERPEAAAVGRYRAVYDLFVRTYQALEPVFTELAGLGV